MVGRRQTNRRDPDATPRVGDVVFHAALGMGRVSEMVTPQAARVDFRDGYEALVSTRALRIVARVVHNGQPSLVRFPVRDPSRRKRRRGRRRVR